jgi:predicted pyridoxine 5'-phosphate oxidase superfamily flavin-nucleotide-binding protein
VHPVVPPTGPDAEALAPYREASQRVRDKVIHHLDEHCAAFIRLSPFATLATASPDGWPEVSPRGGDPGFVRVLDERTLAFPGYDGNGMFLSLGNVLVNAEVGLLFICFERRRRLRLNGTASVALEDPLLATWPEAKQVVRVTAREVFPNCPRYIHHHELVERSRFVPRPEHPTPVPDWKRADWATDVLPEEDHARR